MAQELKRHHINELIGMFKLKGGIGLLIRAIWLLIIDLIFERDEPRQDNDWLKF